MITIDSTRGSEDLVVITNTKHGDTAMAEFGTIEFGTYVFGSGNIDISDNGAIIINNRGSET